LTGNGRIRSWWIKWRQFFSISQYPLQFFSDADILSNLNKNFHVTAYKLLTVLTREGETAPSTGGIVNQSVMLGEA
jgi:hypothetical protein